MLAKVDHRGGAGAVRRVVRVLRRDHVGARVGTVVVVLGLVDEAGAGRLDGRTDERMDGRPGVDGIE